MSSILLLLNQTDLDLLPDWNQDEQHDWCHMNYHLSGLFVFFLSHTNDSIIQFILRLMRLNIPSATFASLSTYLHVNFLRNFQYDDSGYLCNSHRQTKWIFRTKYKYQLYFVLHQHTEQHLNVLVYKVRKQITVSG